MHKLTQKSAAPNSEQVTPTAAVRTTKTNNRHTPLTQNLSHMTLLTFVTLIPKHPNNPSNTRAQQVVDVPEALLNPPQMPRHTLLQPNLTRTHIRVQTPLERHAAQRANHEADRLNNGHYKNVNAFHALLSELSYLYHFRISLTAPSE
ncbi:hypothetical protein MUP79_08965 [Candidatus Bathyarchaeota archaeon]|nr:hypothetical protein [Candidatus Bathyarchaeota archaeon]